MLGLGWNSTFLSALKGKGKIDRNAWALFHTGLNFGAPNTSRYEGEVVTYPLRPVEVSRHPVVRVKDIAANGRSLMNGTGFNAGVTADWQQVTLLQR